MAPLSRMTVNAVASALEQTSQGPPLDPLTLICAVVSHHLALVQLHSPASRVFAALQRARIAEIPAF